MRFSISVLLHPAMSIAKEQMAAIVMRCIVVLSYGDAVTNPSPCLERRDRASVTASI
jgi:hypothetical protein